MKRGGGSVARSLSPLSYLSSLSFLSHHIYTYIIYTHSVPISIGYVINEKYETASQAPRVRLELCSPMVFLNTAITEEL